MTKLLNDYREFVDAVTSDSSKDPDAFIETLRRLKEQGCNIARLDTAFTGLCSEAGEANDIVKKLKFQDKPWDEGTVYHLKRELGDVIWYWMQACMALGVDPEEIIWMNIEKLQSRYPEGRFLMQRSEYRKEGDI